MRDTVLHERRTRQILADIVRAYIETGEPVVFARISSHHVGTTEPGDNAQRDDGSGGGRIFISAAHVGWTRSDGGGVRVFAQMVASQARLNAEDEQVIRATRCPRRTLLKKLVERAGHVLAMISRGLGIVVAPPIGKTVVEHVRFVLLPDLRVMTLLIAPGGATRDKIMQVERQIHAGGIGLAPRNI